MNRGSGGRRRKEQNRKCRQNYQAHCERDTLQGPASCGFAMNGCMSGTKTRRYFGLTRLVMSRRRAVAIHGHNKPVTTPRNGLYVTWRIRVITERDAKFLNSCRNAV